MDNKVTLNLQDIKNAPQTIGIYQFLRGREVLYVGKAVNLKARLASHIQNARLDPKEAALIASSTKVKVITTPSEFQALLLESQLIGKLQPRYNRAWKDDKSYLYIEITKDEYPKVLLARGKDIKLKRGQFFGPFSSTRLVQDLIREIRKVVPVCTRPQLGKSPCFHSKIGQCSPCPNAIEQTKEAQTKKDLKKKYRQNIRQVVRILKGQTDPVLKDLAGQLKELSSHEKYEEALVVRNRLMRFERLITQTLGLKEDVVAPQDTEKALESLLKLLEPYFPSLTDLKRIEAYDISNLGGEQATASLVVLTQGQVDKSQYKKFKIRTNARGERKLGDIGMLAQTLERRFSRMEKGWEKPNLIVVDGGKPQVRTVKEALRRANIQIPLIGIAKAPDRLVVGTGNLPTKRFLANHLGFNLIRLLRDESHRFSRKYHLLLRSQELLGK